MRCAERSISFSTPMMHELLADNPKTQTRRVVAGLEPTDTEWACGLEGRYVFGSSENYCLALADHPDNGIACPYGERGDRLWVREPWRTIREYDHLPGSRLPDGASVVYSTTDLWNVIGGRYRHARFMPRRYARIELELLEVRVERVQSISDEDARAEGIAPLGRIAPRGAFCDLWDSINGERKGCAWDDNLWVWALTFKRVAP